MNAAAPGPVTLTADEQRRLSVLLTSPLGQAELTRADEQRAEARHDLLMARLAKRTELSRQEDAAQQIADTLKPQVAELQRALQAKQRELAAAQGDAARAALAAQSADSRLMRRHLWTLGGESVARAIHAIGDADIAARHSWRGLRTEMAVTGTNWRGRETVEPQIVEVDKTLNGFLARMAELRREMEGLLFADLSPAEIERRCEQAIAEARDRNTPKIERKSSLAIPPAFV